VPSDKSERIKARTRLALRAERALGVTSLPISRAALRETIAPASPTRAVGPAAAAKPQLAETRAPIRAPECEISPPQPVHGAPPVRSKAAAALFGASTGPDFVMPSDPITSPVMKREEKIIALKTLDEKHVHGCTKCRLYEHRTKTVFGEGDPDARIMFIGEGPGENEDLAGRPFVGKAGQLLDKMIQAMGLSREQVYIANIVKCRPPNNREPAPDETATCTPYLLQQIETIRPDAIVTLGRPSTQFMLQSKLSMSKLRGQWQSWRGIRVMPTYHPAYVLRSYTRETREAVWSDLKQVLTTLGMPVPPRKGE
jgi:DNA polymerase